MKSFLGFLVWVGVALTTYGCWLVWKPLAFVFGGMWLIIFASTAYGREDK